MGALDELTIKIFADGADLAGIREMISMPLVRGFTTNPTLMRTAWGTDYESFAREALKVIGDKPVSFEVFADDFPTMEDQALRIASWGGNVNVKIPITNTKGESAAPLVKRLSEKGVICNITAMFTLDHVDQILDVLSPVTPAILSIFAGRIADTGMDPVPLMTEAVKRAKRKPKAAILWASPREVLNIFQADGAGCHIITVANDMLKKLSSVDKDLNQFSVETVKMFYSDAMAAGYQIATGE